MSTDNSAKTTVTSPNVVVVPANDQNQPQQSQPAHSSRVSPSPGSVPRVPRAASVDRYPVVHPNEFAEPPKPTVISPLAINAWRQSGVISGK